MYDAEIEYLISSAMEDNAKAYAIDVVPGGLENHMCMMATFSQRYLGRKSHDES